MKDWLKLLTQYPGSVMPLAYPITSYISLTRWRYQEPRVTTAFTLEKNYFAHSQKMKLFSWVTQFWCILMHFFWFLDNFLFWKVPGLLHCALPPLIFLVLQQAVGARAQVRLHWIELLSSCCTICHPDWCTLHPAWCIFLAPAHHIKISLYTLPTKPRCFCTRWRKIELGRV